MAPKFPPGKLFGSLFGTILVALERLCIEARARITERLLRPAAQSIVRASSQVCLEGETDFVKSWYKCSADSGGRPIVVQGILETCMVETSHRNDDWRRDLKVKIAWTLAAKLLGLILLWFLFFRGNHS
jgi:hypothetical protein